MRINYLLLTLFALSSVMTQAQDLTGTWVGHSGMSYVKLVVIHKGDSLLGYTYDEKPGYCQATFLGLYDSKKKYLKGKGIQMLRNSGGHGLALYDLDYFKQDDREMLNGTVKSKGALLEFLTFGGSKIFLRKEKNEVDTIAFMQPFIDKTVSQSAPPVVKPEVKSTQTDTIYTPTNPIKTIPSVETAKKARASKVVQHIYIDGDSIKIALYDNGEVDQDSVTLFFDDAVILNRYMISEKAKELTIAVPNDGKEHSLELFAHNLGTIPPNTALIIITTGKKRFELRASYDLSTNAQIIISRSK